MRALAIIAAVIASVGVVVVLLLRGGSSGSDREPAPAATADPNSPEAKGAAGSSGASANEGGRAPGSGHRPALAAAPTALDDEPRDHGWASVTETDLGRRLRELLTAANDDTIDIAKLECRTSRCRFLITGRDPTRFRQFLETLQGPSGFYGRAKQLVLKNYRPAKGEGEASVEVVLQFGR